MTSSNLPTFFLDRINILKSKIFSLKKELEPVPWITFSAKKYIDLFLNKDMVVFEWGSGGSTLYFAKNVKMIFSVEHDALWYKVIKNELSEKKIGNCDYKLIKPVKETGRDKKGAVDYKSTDAKFKNYSFKNYCEYIDKFPDNFFDLILIDGRARIACAKHAYNKINRKGVIVLDNSDRETYLPAIKFLLKMGYKQTKFIGKGPVNNYKWQTSIFLKK